MCLNRASISNRTGHPNVHQRSYGLEFLRNLSSCGASQYSDTSMKLCEHFLASETLSFSELWRVCELRHRA